MNSILQCLIATPNFVSAINRNANNTNSRSSYKGRIAGSLQALLEAYLIAKSKQDKVSKTLDSRARDFLRTFGDAFEPFSYVM